MSTLGVRCLSPHKKTSLFTICSCESPLCARTLQRSTSGACHPGRCLNRLSKLGPPRSHNPHCCMQIVNGYTSLTTRQRLRLQKGIPRSQQLPLLTVPRAHFSDWLKIQLNNFLHQLKRLSAVVPDRLDFKAKQSPDLKRKESEPSDIPESDQPPPKSLSAPITPSEKFSKKKKVTTPEPQVPEHEQHTLEQALYTQYQSIASYLKGQTLSQKFPVEDQKPKHFSQEFDSIPQLTTSMKEKGSNLNISQLFKLPNIPFSFRAPKGESTPVQIHREENAPEIQHANKKDGKQKLISVESPSTENVLKKPSAKDTSDSATNNKLLYDHITKPPDHHTRNTAQYYTRKKTDMWEMFRNLLFLIQSQVGSSQKKNSAQESPPYRTSATNKHFTRKQHPYITEEDNRLATMEDTHRWTTPLPPPSSTTFTHSKDQAEEKEGVWSTLKKLVISLGSSPMPRKKKRIFRQKNFVPQTEIEFKTRGLVNSLKSAETYEERVQHVKNLSQHIKKFPSSQHEATELKAVPLLLPLLKSQNHELAEEAMEALALLGYNAPVKGHGIRILCLDGGGTRALVSIMCLRQLEKLTNKRVYELFDYVCGVSTGALLATILFLFRMPLDECERLYHNFSRQMFSRSRVIGTGGLVWNYAFYDSDQWEQILRDGVGHRPMIEFARDPLVPKIAAISTIINTPRMENFVFRSYNFPPTESSQYQGSSTNALWEVIRASSAAPGYYEDFRLGDYVHSDGGILANNPTALAIHESHLLWPKEKIQCVVSLGTGRYEPIVDLGSVTKVSLREKVSKLVDNATDTEAIHVMMADVMPPDTYFRFNPYLSEDIALDEINAERLEGLRRDTTLYLRKNDLKMVKAAKTLTQTRQPHQQVLDWLKLRSDSLL